MIFELTDALQNSILSAMENQEKSFLVDAEKGELVEAIPEIEADDDLYYNLPTWDSSDGFKLREQFVETLHSPLARDELMSVLQAGKGVFRGFKDVMKLYPEVRKRWHYFKNRILRVNMNEWYNTLRETWGLEKLDYEPEDIGDLVRDDFSFEEYVSLKDKEDVLNCLPVLNGEFSDWPEEVEKAITDLDLHRMKYGEGKEFGIISRAVSSEFAGALIFTPCPDDAKKTVVVKSFFVVTQYRGLGIGTELLSTAFDVLKKRGIMWVLIADAIIPDSMQPLLERSGFEKIGSSYIANMFAN
jgi:GNAT superfamily N-acetyltransferase